MQYTRRRTVYLVFCLRFYHGLYSLVFLTASLSFSSVDVTGSLVNVRRVNAISAVLAQVHAAGGGWLTSTLELQLASLDLCRACRDFSTLTVRVERGTPRSLRYPRGLPTTCPDARNSADRDSTVRVPSRVPLVSPFGLTWALMADTLFLELEKGYWNKLVALRVARVKMIGTMRGAVWPTKLKKLSFGQGLNQPIVGVVWPASLEQLVFGSRFNKPVEGVVWPASLKKLEFGDSFNQSFAGVVRPASLESVGKRIGGGMIIRLL